MDTLRSSFSKDISQKSKHKIKSYSMENISNKLFQSEIV